MNKKLFGTDGIRGIYNKSLFDDTALRLGMALGGLNKTIVIGRDTRLSGKALSDALTYGIMSVGGDVIDLGIVPTPIVAYVTERAKADAGVVITASHNPSEYNGLKVFDSSGVKLDDEREEALEKAMFTDIPLSKSKGRLIDGREWKDRYITMILDRFSGISGLNVGFDPANGALSHIGSDILKRLNLGVFAINDKGDGKHINNGCGALYPEAILTEVKAKNLDIGFAFDGDADRIIAVSKDYGVINGDLILYVLAKAMKKAGKLSNNVVIGTIYTNMGVEKALKRQGITLLRVDVGDSNVSYKMSVKHSSLGGERAGHIIINDYMPTGDGLYVALSLCEVMTMFNATMSDLIDIEEYPEKSFDIVTDMGGEIARDVEILDLKAKLDAEMHGFGRILMRPSGTENKLRIMVESEDAGILDSVGKRLVDAIVNKYNI